MAAATTARAAVRIAGHVTLDDGREFPVRNIDGFTMEQLAQGKELVKAGAPEEAARLTYAIAARLVVGLAPAEVLGTAGQQGLTDQEIARIIGVAVGRVEEVQAALGKDGAAPAATTS